MYYHYKSVNSTNEPRASSDRTMAIECITEFNKLNTPQFEKHHPIIISYLQIPVMLADNDQSNPPSTQIIPEEQGEVSASQMGASQKS